MTLLTRIQDQLASSMPGTSLPTLTQMLVNAFDAELDTIKKQLANQPPTERTPTTGEDGVVLAQPDTAAIQELSLQLMQANQSLESLTAVTGIVTERLDQLEATVADLAAFDVPDATGDGGAQSDGTSKG